MTTINWHADDYKIHIENKWFIQIAPGWLKHIENCLSHWASLGMFHLFYICPVILLQINETNMKWHLFEYQ